MQLPVWAWVAAGWLALEALMLVALRYVHRRTSIYYLPRGRPRLSRQATATLERMLAENGRGAVMEHSATLGWTLRPGVSLPDGRVHTSSRGLRGAREPAPAAAPGVTRVLTFGDCLTFGGGVSDEGTFQSLMEQKAADLEVLNFGVDGYGPVQMLLRYRESRDWCRAHQVAILCMASSNVFKALNSFRPYLAYDHGLPFAQPRALVRDGRLEIAPNPLPSLDHYRRLLSQPARELPRIGATDDYYLSTLAWSPADVLPSVRLTRMGLAELRKMTRVMTPRGVYRASSTAAVATLCVLDAFVEEAVAQGARPIIAVLPTPRDVRMFVSRGINASSQIVSALHERGIETLDLLDSLGGAAKMHGPARLFNRWHYSEYGNELVARRLIAAIRTVEAEAEVSDRAQTRTRSGTLQAARRP